MGLVIPTLSPSRLDVPEGQGAVFLPSAPADCTMVNAKHTTRQSGCADGVIQ